MSYAWCRWREALPASLGPLRSNTAAKISALTRSARARSARRCSCGGPAGVLRRPDLEERFARSEPLKRLGEPEEVGETVAWLCSNRASYVTGLPMPVDGGFFAQ